MTDLSFDVLTNNLLIDVFVVILLSDSKTYDPALEKHLTVRIMCWIGNLLAGVPELPQEWSSKGAAADTRDNSWFYMRHKEYELQKR